MAPKDPGVPREPKISWIERNIVHIVCLGLIAVGIIMGIGSCLN